jgi:hypothetical protein
LARWRDLGLHKITVTVRRDGAEKDIEITLGAKRGAKRTERPRQAEPEEDEKP